ncbi:MAG: hypothetical protein FWH20_09220 [Oscillospiraceae bacterium]|nr:hypothetical protein [Oscillospiraceae bacterium]
MKKLPTLLLAAILTLQVLAFTACEQTPAGPADPIVTPEPIEPNELIEPAVTPEPIEIERVDEPEFAEPESNPLIGTWNAEEDGILYEVFYNADGGWFSIEEHTFSDETYIGEGTYVLNGNSIKYFTDRVYFYDTENENFFEIFMDFGDEPPTPFEFDGENIIWLDYDDLVYSPAEPSGRWEFGREVPPPSFENLPYWQADSPIIGTWGDTFDSEGVELTSEVGFNQDGKFYLSTSGFAEALGQHYAQVYEGVYVTEGDVLKMIRLRLIELLDGEIYAETPYVYPESAEFSVEGDTLTFDNVAFERVEPSGIWLLD